MKKNITSILETAFATMLISSVAIAGQTGKTTPGPKGGKLLENEAPRAEFFVEKDRTITITFYDDALKPLPAAEQVLTAVVEAPAGKRKLEFEKKGDVLVSKAPLPEGEYNIVAQIKSKPDAKVQNFRIKFAQTIYGECRRSEYACICDE